MTDKVHPVKSQQYDYLTRHEQRQYQLTEMGEIMASALDKELQAVNNFWEREN